MKKGKKSLITNIKIIGGALKGRALPVPNNEQLRPTLNRVRETLFNWLQLDIKDATCLDVFAGTGALGFEAASRGARQVIMLESNKLAFSSIIKSNEKLGLSSIVKVINENAMSWLERQDLSKLDIIFLDPPYNTKLLEEAITILTRKKIQALVFIEDDKDFRNILPEDWQLLKFSSAGEVFYGLCWSSNS